MIKRIADRLFGNYFKISIRNLVKHKAYTSLGFGLASFLAMQRTKEVGVRKVLGASVSQIVGIFYKDFLMLIGISALVGGVITYFGISFWLNNYATRIDFPWFVIGLAAVILIVFAFMTVGYQTYRVAILNPARTLKYE